MKKNELAMAEFLEALKAPQSRRILDNLALKDMSIEHLIKCTKLSKNSIHLHLQPLIKAKLVTKRRNGLLKFNKKKFDESSSWFRLF